MQALGLDELEMQRHMEPDVADALPELRPSAPAVLQRAWKRKRADMSASPSTDRADFSAGRAFRPRRMSAPAQQEADKHSAQVGQAPRQPSARQREAVKLRMRRNNARLLREAAAKRAASSNHDAQAAEGSPHAAAPAASPVGRKGSPTAPPSPDMGASVQVLAGLACFQVPTDAKPVSVRSAAPVAPTLTLTLCISGKFTPFL